jgi:MoxR-like ATPase
MMKLIVNYPSASQEAIILKMHSRQESISERLQTEIETVTTPEEINAAIKQNGEVIIDDALVDYINRIVRITRNWPQIYMGASPRAGLALMQGARTLAAFQGRDYAIPDDVVQITLPVLRHRVILTAEAEVEGQEVDQILADMIRTVEVPRI